MTTLPPLATAEETNTIPSAQPLPISVTSTGQATLALHTLLRQVLPALEQPDSYPEGYRRQLAERVRALLTDLVEEGEEQEDTLATMYEPGCWLEEEPW